MRAATTTTTVFRFQSQYFRTFDSAKSLLGETTLTRTRRLVTAVPTCRQLQHNNHGHNISCTRVVKFTTVAEIAVADNSSRTSTNTLNARLSPSTKSGQPPQQQQQPPSSHNRAVLDLAQRIPLHDKAECKRLIQSYAQNNSAEEATLLLDHFLTHASDITSSERLIGTVVNAWAQSARRDAFDQALALVRRIDSNPKCQLANVRCNRVIWGAVLKCLTNHHHHHHHHRTATTSSKHARENAGKMAVALLDEMEQRHRNGDAAMVEPDMVTFTLVLKACLLSGDTELAATVWQRMLQSNSPPNVRTYSDILNHYCQLGTPSAAQQAEQILQSMKQRAAAAARNSRDDDNDAVRPNSYSYGIVLNAWARSGDARCTDRMWDLYQQTIADGVPPDLHMYRTLIYKLAHTKNVTDVQRADTALQALEENEAINNDYTLYSNVLHGYAHCNDAESATRVLIRLIHVYLRGGLSGGRDKANQSDKRQQPQHPQPKLFQVVASAWIRSGNVRQATAVTEKMQELHDRGQLPQGPDVRTYQTLQTAWEQSSSTDATAAEQQKWVAKLEARIALLLRRQQRKEPVGGS
jgi:pentatricopeptide repeat protein